MLPVEEFRETVRSIAEILTRLEIRFHVTGGAAFIAYAEPRLTQDIDLVIDQPQILKQLSEFIQAAGAGGFELDAASVRDAVQRKKPFQLLDRVRILKLDLYPRELIPGELDRSIQLEAFPGLSVPLVCKSDLMLSKLHWVDLGSHKGRRDLRWLWRVATTVEQATVRTYASEHRLEVLLDEVLNESDELEPMG